MASLSSGAEWKRDAEEQVRLASFKLASEDKVLPVNDRKPLILEWATMTLGTESFEVMKKVFGAHLSSPKAGLNESVSLTGI